MRWGGISKGDHGRGGHAQHPVKRFEWVVCGTIWLALHDSIVPVLAAATLRAAMDYAAHHLFPHLRVRIGPGRHTHRLAPAVQRGAFLVPGLRVEQVSCAVVQS